MATQVAGVSLSEAETILAMAPQVWEEVTIRDGNFSNGNQHNASLNSGKKGTVGHLEIGEDDPTSRAIWFVLGELRDPATLGSGQTEHGSIDVELKTAADGAATTGAKAGFGIVDSEDKVSDNAYPVRDEARIDDAVTNRELQKKFFARRGNVVLGASGEFLTFTAQAPPGSSESYGMDHCSIEVDGLMLTHKGIQKWRNR